MKNLKFIMALFILCNLIVFCGKGNRNSSEISDENATSISVDKLYSDYHENEVKADNLYKGKVLKISGVVSDISKDFLDNIVIGLKTENEFMNIHCEINKSYSSTASDLKKGDAVIVTGKCKGMIIGSVMIDNCKISQSGGGKIK